MLYSSLGVGMTHFVHIPLHRTDEVLEIPITSLPRNCKDIIRILKNEEAPVDVWVHSAVWFLPLVWCEVFDL